jgi:competence protein ComEA
MSATDKTGTSRQASEASASVQVQVRAQMRDRIEAEVREEIVPRLHAQLRARYRLYLVGLTLIGLVVGGLIGRYGFGASVYGSEQVVAPTSRWGVAEGPAMIVDTGVVKIEDAVVSPSLTHLRVYVSGAVEHQRVVTVPIGSLVSDALEAAGGATDAADLDAVNLAATLADHQHVVVPTRVGSPTVTASTSQTLIDVNSASVEELQTLPGIGATRAADIVAYREAHGPFQRVEDIESVPGIGPGILERIALLITVEP